MGRRKANTPAGVSEDRLRWLRGRLTPLGKDLAAARKTKNFASVAALHRQQLVTRNEYDSERMRLAELHALESDAADRVLTAEEWESEVRDDASSATDQDLEHYVAEFFRRQGYLMVATGDELELRRLAS